MDMDRVRIADVITTKYSDFLSFCSASGKIFISELTNVDFVAFRTSSGQSRDYIKSIINVPDSYAKGTIRISLGKDNTIEEAKIIGETLVSVLMEQK